MSEYCGKDYPMLTFVSTLEINIRENEQFLVRFQQIHLWVQVLDNVGSIF